MQLPKGAHEIRNQPGAEAERIAQGHNPASRVEQLLDGRNPIVELRHHLVDMRLELGAGMGQAQHPPGTLQQGRPQLLLQPGQGARDAGLAHGIRLRHLGEMPRTAPWMT